MSRTRAVALFCFVGSLFVATVLLTTHSAADANTPAIAPTATFRAITPTPVGYVALGTATIVPIGSRVPLPATPSTVNVSLVGAPAIVPRSQPADATSPTFTAQDASSYALAHLPAQLQNSGASVKNVIFANNSVALAQFQTGIGGIPDRLLCIVQLNGSFIVSAPGYSRTATAANLLFDGQTGNYLGLTIPY